MSGRPGVAVAPVVPRGVDVDAFHDWCESAEARATAEAAEWWKPTEPGDSRAGVVVAVDRIDGRFLFVRYGGEAQSRSGNTYKRWSVQRREAGA